MIFRELQIRDLEWFISVRNEVSQMLHNSAVFSLQQAINWFPTSETKYWVINMNGHDVGYFRILETSDHRVLIGADIATSYQGKGIASEAYPKFVQEILIPSGITELELRVLKKNEVAIKLYNNLGFVVDEETSSDYHMIMSVHKNNS